MKLIIKCKVSQYLLIKYFWDDNVEELVVFRISTVEHNSTELVLGQILEFHENVSDINSIGVNHLIRFFRELNISTNCCSLFFF